MVSLATTMFDLGLNSGLGTGLVLATFSGANLRSTMLALSLVLGILPLLGIVWVLMNGMITTVDGLFMSLILLTLSGVFMLNVFWEMRDLGMIKKKTPPRKRPRPRRRKLRL